MSAIAGLIRLDGAAASAETVAAMLAAMAHRAPHGTAVWADGPAALGHGALHTTPESLRERQPVVHDAGEPIVLVADARVDNRDELLASRPAGAPPSDAELLLDLYLRDRSRAPERVLGDFAFVVWEASQRRVVCARDPLGVKPLYFAQRPGRLFAFASEIRGLLAVPEIAATAPLNEDRLADYLLGTHDTRSTFYRGIERLPPAHLLVLDPERGPQPHAYWRLDPERELRLDADADYAEGFRHHFDAAVRCRMRSAFPVGAALSGGLDSSSIAVTARDLRGDAAPPLPTFSAVFPGLPDAVLPRIDERPFVEAVLETGGFEPHLIRADRLSPLHDHERMAWHSEDIPRAFNLYMHWALLGAAQSRGVRVFLDGLDGDAVVSHGYARLGELAGAEAWDALAEEVEALSRGRRSSMQGYLRQHARPHLAELARHLRWRRLWRGLHTLHGRLGGPWRDYAALALGPLVPSALRRQRAEEPPSAIRTDFARRTGALERRAAYEHRPPHESAREAHIRGLRSPLYVLMLELADKASAAFGIEMRYPFFDRRLVEYCVSLPADQKLRDGWTRYVLRRAMEGRLPAQLQWRPHKSDLSPNFYLRLLDADRPLLEQVLFDEEHAVAPYVDVAAVQAAYRRFAADPLRQRQAAFDVFGVVTLELWLRRFTTA